MFNAPGIPAKFGGTGGDPRTPDIIVQPNVGVVYTGSAKKQAEHGGFAHDDTNVILLVSHPRLGVKTVTSFVETTQVAPTILELLGLNPTRLDAVRHEGTPGLPGLTWGDDQQSRRDANAVVSETAFHFLPAAPHHRPKVGRRERMPAEPKLVSDF